MSRGKQRPARPPKAALPATAPLTPGATVCYAAPMSVKVYFTGKSGSLQHDGRVLQRGDFLEVSYADAIAFCAADQQFSIIAPSHAAMAPVAAPATIFTDDDAPSAPEPAPELAEPELPLPADADLEN